MHGAGTLIAPLEADYGKPTCCNIQIGFEVSIATTPYFESPMIRCFELGSLGLIFLGARSQNLINQTLWGDKIN